MKITIKTLKNKKFQIDVNESDTIGQIKNRIDNELKLGEASSQKLIHSGKILKDDQTIASAKILENDFLVVMISATKPSGKKTDDDAPSAPSAVAAPESKAAASASSNVSSSPSAAPSSSPPSAAAASPAAPAAAPPSASPAAAAAAPPPADASSALVTGPAYQEMVMNLMQLGGFSQEQVIAALQASFNNPHRAVEYLFNGIPASAQQPRAPAAGGGGAAAPPAGAPVEDDSGDVEPDAEMNEDDPQGGAPDIQQLRQLLQQNPAVLPMLINQLSQSNPAVAQQLRQNPEALLALLGANPLAGAQPGGGGGGGGGGMGGRTVIQLTQEEKAALDRIEAFGFGRQRSLEAFLICDKNEELAANYLFDHANDDMDAAPRGNQGGGGGGQH